MKPNKTQLVVAMAVLIALCLGASAYGTQPVWKPFDYKVEPVELPKEAGPVTLLFEIAAVDVCLNCPEIKVTVEPVGGVEYFGPESFTIQAEKGSRYTGTLDISIKPNDTGSLWIRMWTEDPPPGIRCSDRFLCSFVTTGDTLEYFEGFPRPKPEPPPLTQVEREALSRTPEKLAQIHGIRVFLIDSIQQEIFKSIVGPLPENHRGRFYYLETTWGNMLQLGDSGIDWRYIPPGEDPFPSLAPPPHEDR